MTTGLIEIIKPGFANGIQDTGRYGYRHMGVAVSGFLDQLFARCANALVGNTDDAACIEMRVTGPVLAVRQGPVRVALAGNVTATIRRATGAAEELTAWRSATLGCSDMLEIGAVKGGTSYLAVSGGIAVTPHLGSRSTYQRAKIGGIEGRLIAAGDVLPCTAASSDADEERQAPPWRHADGPIRVVLGPQIDHFATEAVATFMASGYQVTPQLDRMGMRLQGEKLAHVTSSAADIVSDGVTPGAIQVPGEGQPIILLADCQTVGGYPKIATVICADRPRLGQLVPGQTVRFAATDVTQARIALEEQERAWRTWASQIVFGGINFDAVYGDGSGCWKGDDDEILV